MSTERSTPETYDGRRARRERGRQAVIDATLDLFLEGGERPTSEEVAARAGVSVASVFRYFESLDELRHQATLRFLDRHAPLYEVEELGEGSLEDRVERFVAARLALHRAVAPIARVVRVRAVEHPALADALDSTRRTLAEQVRAHFAPELEGLDPTTTEDVVGLIATISAFEAWDQLTNVLDRTEGQIARAWTSALTTLLTD